jgi:hypothetical protein
VRLAGFDVAVLTDLLHLHEDRLPRTVIYECASRGELMVKALAALVDDRTYWNEDVGSGEWWALHHAVMILGLVASERAAEALVTYMRRMDLAGDDNLQEWLDSRWPALFANKPAACVPLLRSMAQDRDVGWYTRMQAFDVVLAAAERESAAALDDALDWAAEMISDETESWDFRLLASNTLISFVPENHRPLLEAIAARQSRREAVFSAQDIAEAYGGKPPEPDWHRHATPWEFYAPDEIVKRQEQWAQRDAEIAAEEEAIFQPYIREQPKIGRNDPCPCGSGKKYKHCCGG